MASWSWFIRNSTILETKYLYMQDKGTSVPVTDLGYLPQPFDINNLPAMGMYTDVNQANLNVVGGYEYTGYATYKRRQFKINVTQFLDVGKTTHEIKGGVATPSGRRTSTACRTGGGRSRGSRPRRRTIARATTSSSPRRWARAARGRSSRRTR